MVQKIKILLADDTLIAREGWKKILETEIDLEVVGEATFAAEVERKVKELSPDILLMDLKWYGDDFAGWTTIKEIKQNYKVRVIAVTAFEGLIRDARLAGADSAMLKTFSRDELLREIREQYSKRDENIPAVMEQGETLGLLTARETDVLKLLGKGDTDQEISMQLNIAISTAKNHVKNIFNKLEVSNRLKAVAVARERGLIK